LRILIFHGYLLSGTGSNVYNARLAEALVGLGHEVHLLSQDRHPQEHSFVDAVGDWEKEAMQVQILREPVRCTVYRPNIGSLLPVYVADRYEGIEARTFAQCTEEEVDSYIQANVNAVRDVVFAVKPDIALANHLVMGPVILARALKDSKVPYAVKVHGSALEYTVKPSRERFLGLALEGVSQAKGILVGSRHTAKSLWAALDDPAVKARTRLGPPGVDVHRFRPREQDEAHSAIGQLAMRLRESSGAQPQHEAQKSAFSRDELAAAVALERLDPVEDRLVAFVGKLIVSKGVDLLSAAWPLVLEQIPQAKLVVVGFGAYRSGLERLIAALGDGDLAQAREIALAGRALETESQPPRALGHLLAFFDSLKADERERYLKAARALPEHLVLTGRLDHEELAELLPACEALVVPSTFPEAFGMVAVEGAACGALPISAEHSGLIEVSEVLACTVPEQVAPWLSFVVDDNAVRVLAEHISSWLMASAVLKSATRTSLVATVRQRWSWEGVAEGVIAGASGQLDQLSSPGVR
jgi:glycosyltransferase involved in cell wall biosynthesis